MVLRNLKDHGLAEFEGSWYCGILVATKTLICITVFYNYLCAVMLCSLVISFTPHGFVVVFKLKNGLMSAFYTASTEHYCHFAVDPRNA